MTEKKNAAQDVAEDLFTDPDADAEQTPRPVPPQTVENEDDDSPRR